MPERDDGRRVPVGTTAQLLRRLHVQRLPVAVLVQVQPSRRRLEETVITRPLGARRPARSSPHSPLSRYSPPAHAQRSAQTRTTYQRAAEAAYEKYKNLNEGKNADYIPALAKVIPISSASRSSRRRPRLHRRGHQRRKSRFSRCRRSSRWRASSRTPATQGRREEHGRRRTGIVFNSIVAIEENKGHEMNPLVNAGAITTTSMIGGSIARLISGRRSSKRTTSSPVVSCM